MGNIFDSYDLHVEELSEFYRKLNEPIAFPDGMVTSLGIIYWVREEHVADLVNAIPRIKAEDIHRFSEVLEAIRTPGLMKKLAQRTGISGDLLRILKHDIENWLPKPVSLAALEPIQKYSEHWGKLASIGICDQLQMISAGQSPRSRESLSSQTGIPIEVVEEIVKCCDVYRTGANLKHIRARIYYDMGLDSQQKWASSTSEKIIERFTEYIQKHDLDSVRLIPWPKEVRNGIEWAKLHVSIFAIEW